ncbi:MAG: ankyrin repeat domain-containing protein [Bdellovibrio sp.]
MNSFKNILCITSAFISINSFASGGSKPLEPKVPDTAEVFEQAAKGQLAPLQLSLDSGFDVNQINKKGESLLMTAAANGKTDSVKYLISKKANINLKDNDQKSALYYAITNEEHEIAKLLIDSGADLNSLNEIDDTALILASSVNDANTMKLILQKDPNLINKANKEGKTPLMEAARHGSSETVKILLSAGADKLAKNELGKTSLDIAKKAQNHDVVRLLNAKK